MHAVGRGRSFADALWAAALPYHVPPSGILPEHFVAGKKSWVALPRSGSVPQAKEASVKKFYHAEILRKLNMHTSASSCFARQPVQVVLPSEKR